MVSRKVEFHESQNKELNFQKNQPTVQLGKSTNMDVNNNMSGWTNVPMYMLVLATLFAIAVIVIWIMGLIRMGRCNGKTSALFWVTLFAFLFVPGIGQLWGFAIGIAALVLLRKGGHLMDIKCTK